jgi:SseB protein N-terminal domain
LTGFLKKYFKKRGPEVPDNRRLLTLLSNYWEKGGGGKSYELVALELMHGNCFLLLPTRELTQTGITGWSVAESDQKINLASVYTLDGQQVLAAFTDEQALLDWSKKPCPYVSLSGPSVLELCESNNYSKLIINNRSENTFVLERRQKAVEHYAIRKGTTIQIGPPSTPLDPKVIARLTPYFKSTEGVLEVYHYGQVVNQAFSLVLGFWLQNPNPEIEGDIVAAVQVSLGAQKPTYPVDIRFFDDGEEFEQVKGLGNALIYKKS